MTGVVPAIATAKALREALASSRIEGAVLGLVPTMGALHEGHLSLIELASEQCDAVVVSIFVNPTQFGAGEDFASYPRDLKRDAALAHKGGARWCFAPAVSEMYPGGDLKVSVDPGPLGEELEGASRPGHFRGVATIVAKLFALIWPARAFFGEKDYQQLLVLGQMARDLSFPIEVIGAPTVRERDGLALSSRNGRLSPVEREAAPALHRALVEGSEVAATGVSPSEIEAVMRAVIEAEPLASLDYAVARDSANLALPGPDTEALRLLVAARVGGVRLIDNLAVAR